jgi:hypothetical protein
MNEECPMHQPVDCEEMTARYSYLFSRLDVGRALRCFAFGGFDRFAENYFFAYGEMSSPLRPRGEYTPEERKSLTPPHDPGA